MKRVAAVKEREVARAVHNTAAASTIAAAREAVLLAVVYVETELWTANLSLTFPVSSCSFRVEDLPQCFYLEAFGI